MEKSGSGKNGILKPGLLKFPTFAAAFSLLALAMPLAALTVSVDVSETEIDSGSELTVRVIAYGADAADTSFLYGELPPAFILVGSRKESARLEPPRGDSSMGQSGAAVPSTVYEISLRALKPGVWSVGPFDVRSGTEGFHYAAVPITVRGDPYGEDRGKSLQWVLSGSGASRVGSARTLVLMGPESAFGAPVACPAPENALLEPIPADERPAVPDVTGIVALAFFRWTPLYAGDQSLPSASVSSGRDTLVSERVSVPVYPAASSPAREKVSAPLAGAFTENPKAAGSQSGPDAEESGSLIAESLARLRAAEYGSLFPAKAREARIAFERELGLNDSIPVPPAAWKLPAVLGSAFCIALAFFLSILSTRAGFLRGFALAASFLALGLAIFAVTLYIRDGRRAGVAEGGPLFNVPENGSRAVETIPDGMALYALREAGDWLYAENAAGARGWLHKDRFHGYTGTDTE